ncbi:MAG: virulence protein SciE type [Herminiimonas sp.]|nr:virulence protein SciE type [Herminiimonas sp.]
MTLSLTNPDSIRCPAIPLALRLDKVQAAIRTQPGKADLRVYLFQLLCLTGQWERARTQLQLCAQLDAGALSMATIYREALNCERDRAEVFTGRRKPHIIGVPPSWLSMMIEAQHLLAAGDSAGARCLRDNALEQAPATGGSLDGQRFDWLCDADSRLGPIIEAIIGTRYCWIAISQLRCIELDMPQDLRDLVWLPARLTFIEKGEQMALIPVRYPGSEAADDDVRMARATRWIDFDGDGFAGSGQRMLATDQGEHALLDVRRILFDIPA